MNSFLLFHLVYYFAIKQNAITYIEIEIQFLKDFLRNYGFDLDNEKNMLQMNVIQPEIVAKNNDKILK